MKSDDLLWFRGTDLWWTSAALQVCMKLRVVKASWTPEDSKPERAVCFVFVSRCFAVLLERIGKMKWNHSLFLKCVLNMLKWCKIICQADMNLGFEDFIANNDIFRFLLNIPKRVQHVSMMFAQVYSIQEALDSEKTLWGLAPPHCQSIRWSSIGTHDVALCPGSKYQKTRRPKLRVLGKYKKQERADRASEIAHEIIEDKGVAFAVIEYEWLVDYNEYQLGPVTVGKQSIHFHEGNPINLHYPLWTSVSAGPNEYQCSFFVLHHLPFRMYQQTLSSHLSSSQRSDLMQRRLVFLGTARHWSPKMDHLEIRLRANLIRLSFLYSFFKLYLFKTNQNLLDLTPPPRDAIVTTRMTLMTITFKKKNQCNNSLLLFFHKNMP